MQMEPQLIQYCSPTLSGLKAGSLFSLQRGDLQLPSKLDFPLFEQDTNLRVRILHHCTKRFLIFLYRADLLEQHLNEGIPSKILHYYGYRADWTLQEKLNLLSERIDTCQEFPHEIGLFLDYPPLDVLSFIQNKGENYKLCGIWKVYHNPEQAREIFRQYEKCKQTLQQQIAQGKTLFLALAEKRSI